MQKRMALCLFGISLLQFRHRSRELYHVNYQNSLVNYHTYIYQYFKEKGYLIDVYLSTNLLNENDKQKLLQIYQPIASSFHENEEDYYHSRNIKLDSVLDLCLSSKIQYDMVLVTRFDLHFQKNFHESNIDFTKFNLVSILELPHLICDNFYLFPYSVLPLFSKVVKKNMHVSHHYIKSDMDDIKGPDYINYILNENRIVQLLSFYKIVRNKIK
jgi:hypothetical protein